MTDNSDDQTLEEWLESLPPGGELTITLPKEVNMQNYFKILREFSSILESLGMDYTGQAKEEISNLKDYVRGSALDQESKKTILTTLDKTVYLIRSGEISDAIFKLGDLNRNTWDTVLAKFS